jgi:fructokinase
MFRRAAGGAVSNVAVGIARLGGSAAFVGAVSRDAFGKFLLQTLAHENVNVDATRLVDANTTLAFVARGPEGERAFEFVRNPGADSTLTAADLDSEFIARARVVHFGGVLLSAEPGKSATLRAAALGRNAGALVTFDPNARPALFTSAHDMRSTLRSACAQADLIKCSTEDLAAMGLERDAAPELVAGATQAVVVTDGPHEVAWMCRDGARGTWTPPKVKPVDTTGAGDAFMAALLVCLVDEHHAHISAEALAAAVPFASAAGAFACLKEGAIPSLPRAEDISKMLRA